VTQDPLNALPGSAGSPERGRETSGPFGGTTTNGTPAKDSATIRGMFAAIAPRYDLLNHLLSGGLDLYWRRVTVETLLARLARAPRTNGQSASRSSGTVGARRVLDLCAGTLDLSCALADSRRFAGRTVALDFALPMLRRGRRKLGGRRARRIVPLCGDGLELPFRDGSFEAVMVAFGVRNFENLGRGLVEARRVLAPGGVLLVLEFSRPENALFRNVYELYSRRVLPVVGGAISGHGSAYRYLPASVAGFPDASGLARRLEEAGYERVRYRLLTGGIVALHEAWRPSEGGRA
jgi:demethylmenaquinone methyltransferase/2-methoxy-6-polyprenyl-1,4-benzoquinol methylase